MANKPKESRRGEKEKIRIEIRQHTDNKVIPEKL